MCSDTVLVSAQPEVRLERIVQRDNIPRKEAQQRIDAQWPLEKCAPLACTLIHNSSSIEDFLVRVDQWYETQSKQGGVLWRVLPTRAALIVGAAVAFPVAFTYSLVQALAA